jgi:hypothetical protein
MNTDVWDGSKIVNRLRREARTGVLTESFSAIEMAYMGRCQRSIGGTKLIFTRDDAKKCGGWWSESSCRRRFHLSISGAPHAEVDVWVRAFFGEHLDLVWREPSADLFEVGNDQVSHWNLFCDADWAPRQVDDVDVDMLLAEGWLRHRGLELRQFAA